jgi:hypothetical protein
VEGGKRLVIRVGEQSGNRFLKNPPDGVSSDVIAAGRMVVPRCAVSVIEEIMISISEAMLRHGFL